MIILLVINPWTQSLRVQ